MLFYIFQVKYLYSLVTLIAKRNKSRYLPITKNCILPTRNNFSLAKLNLCRPLIISLIKRQIFEKLIREFMTLSFNVFVLNTPLRPIYEVFNI